MRSLSPRYRRSQGRSLTETLTNARRFPYTTAVIRLAAGFILLSIVAAGAETKSSGRAPETKSNILYTCHRIRDGVVRIDGDLNEDAWRRAAPMSDFQTAGSNPKPAQYASTARLLWSDKHLFLAFKCRVDRIEAVRTERDAEVYKEECAELYLCPRGAEAKYYEIDFNPLNTIYDSLLSSYRYEEQVKHAEAWARAYNARIQSATRIQRSVNGDLTIWTLEAAIPFADLAEADRVPPRPGDIWLFNVFRIAAVNATEREYSAWVPTEADFHKPWRFPRLQFAN